MTRPSPRNAERSFGISVGTVLCAIAALLWWRGHPLRAEVLGGVGALLLVCGLVYPPVLRRPNAVWMRVGRAVGHFNAGVLLTVVFGLVFVPLSLLWRATGKDPLARRREQWPGWSPYPEKYRDVQHYRRMF